MATGQVWKLKRFGRFVPDSKKKRRQPWQIFEATDKKPDIVLTILESGHLLVMQGEECLDTVSLLCGSVFHKVQQKSDNLMFRITMKGEGRLVRMQFDGSSRAEAIKECSRAAEKLMEYMPVTTQDDTPPPHNQPPTEESAPMIECQQTFQGKAVGNEPEVVQGSLSLNRLTQHYLGEADVRLPQVYQHCPLANGDLEPFIRVCLLDPSFHAFVEKVEGELRKMLQE